MFGNVLPGALLQPEEPQSAGQLTLLIARDLFSGQDLNINLSSTWLKRKYKRK